MSYAGSIPAPLAHMPLAGKGFRAECRKNQVA